MEPEPKKTPALSFAPFPEQGPWTAVGLGRGPFLAILFGAILVYLLWGGPLWSHLGEDDFERILVSYALIPVAVAIALLRDKAFRLSTFLAATGVIAGIKLLATAVLALIFDL